MTSFSFATHYGNEQLYRCELRTEKKYRITHFRVSQTLSVSTSLNCITCGSDVRHRLLVSQRAAWETVLLGALQDQGLKIQRVPTQGRASLSRPAARLVTKRCTASTAFHLIVLLPWGSHFTSLKLAM